VEPAAARLRRAASTRVAVYHYGAGLGWLEEASLSVLRRVYGAAGGEAPGFVELHLYPSRGVMEAALFRLSAEAGAAVEAGYELVYEAWSGVPRIHVPAEAGRGGFFEALLGHEAVHSVLHAGLGFYLVEPPSPSRLGLLAAQLAAAAVKDLEVHGWAALRGLGWLLRGEAGYWEPLLRGMRCGNAGEVGDAARAATVWLAAGGEPPLTPSCRRRLGRVLSLLSALLSSWLRGGERPWTGLGGVAEAVLEALEGLEAEA